MLWALARLSAVEPTILSVSWRWGRVWDGDLFDVIIAVGGCRDSDARRVSCPANWSAVVNRGLGRSGSGVDRCPGGSSKLRERAVQSGPKDQPAGKSIPVIHRSISRNPS